ncbi:PQQ-binding-like beta-propeller repeat protein [uncultured Gimesia sp.]|uniref:outer membrane protein assembly factor BamB family protein n=1 Tax=uncultured Gimesia sp. TaxID=1678688 RepID=UPI0026268E33|nr:PQQ-binding-like beta-propeller repeat protein [uncultured Gimesia sp.]
MITYRFSSLVTFSFCFVCLLHQAASAQNKSKDIPVRVELEKSAGKSPVTANRQSVIHTHGTDWVMRGRDHTRNPVSPDKNAPTDWKIGSTFNKQRPKNVLWSVKLGTVSCGDPVIANGLVWVGTNNDHPRDPKNSGNASVLMCFRERDGKFLYQYVSPRLVERSRLDWSSTSLASSPLVEGDRLWFCNNRCETICLDIGPLHRATGQPRVLWKVDMRRELGVVPCGVMIGSNANHCSIAAYKDLIYVNTTNSSHAGKVPAPDAPSLVCFQKKTGKVVWKDNSPGENILDVQFGSPLVIASKGRGQVIMGQGDGWLRSFDSRTGKLLWKFDINFKSPKRKFTYNGKHNYFVATPVFYKNRVYIASGRHRDHSKEHGRLCCIDVTKRGDISSELDDGSGRGKTNPNSGLVWDFVKRGDKPEDRMHGSLSSVAVHDSLVFAPDATGLIHCLDAETGKKYWTADSFSGIYASPLIADKKVYVANEDGIVFIYELAKQRKLLAERDFNNSIESSPVFANNVLYVMSRRVLHAIKSQK